MTEPRPNATAAVRPDSMADRTSDAAFRSNRALPRRAALQGRSRIGLAALPAIETARRSAPARRRRSAHSLFLSLIFFAVLSSPVLSTGQTPAARGEGFRCGRGTVLTLFGVDTLNRHLLFRTADGWLIELRPDAADPGGGDWTETARYFREPVEPRAYGGSLGGGPIAAVTRCGSGCLQAVTWDAGTWKPLGAPLTGAPSGVAHTTYDGSGTPWLVLQQPLAAGEGPRDGVRAHAYRLADGRWRPAGTAIVRSSGAAAAVAAPGRRDAVVSGTHRFALGEEPQSWLATLPSLPADDVGVLVPVEGGAAYLTAEGRLLISRDGERWVRTRWVPWGQHATKLWAPGRDYTLDLPTGDRRGPLHAVWIDRRPGQTRLYLSTWRPRGEWSTLADVHPEISTLNGERLEYSEIVVAGPDTWVLLTGCVNTANGPGMVLRTHGPEGLTRPRFLPLVPGVSRLP